MLNFLEDYFQQFFWTVGNLHVYCLLQNSSEQSMFLDYVALILHLKSVEKVALCPFFDQPGKVYVLYYHQMLQWGKKMEANAFFLLEDNNQLINAVATKQLVTKIPMIFNSQWVKMYQGAHLITEDTCLFELCMINVPLRDFTAFDPSTTADCWQKWCPSVKMIF